MELIKCRKCGSEISADFNACPECGCMQKKSHNSKRNNVIIISAIVVGAVIISLIIGLIISNNVKKSKYNSLPVKVDISMTSYYGTIEYILYEFDLDFDLVTMGANCYTGVQKNEFRTEKYGILHTEFRYCKSNNTTVFRVYNDSKDQKLRDPKPGEVVQFDSYGYKVANTEL